MVEETFWFLLVGPTVYFFEVVKLVLKERNSADFAKHLVELLYVDLLVPDAVWLSFKIELFNDVFQLHEHRVVVDGQRMNCDHVVMRLRVLVLPQN